MNEPSNPTCDHDAIRARTAGVDPIGCQVGVGGEPDLELFNCPGCGSTIATEITAGPGTLELLREIAGAPAGGWPRLDLPKVPARVVLDFDAEIGGKTLATFLEEGGELVPNGHRLIIAGDFSLTGPTAERILPALVTREVV